ncbi:hypothetical protein [Thermaerobacter litoralis]
MPARRYRQAWWPRFVRVNPEAAVTMRHWTYRNVHALILPEEEDALAATLFPDQAEREAARRTRRWGRSVLDRALDRALREAYDTDPASFRQRYVVRKVGEPRARKVFGHYVAIYEAVYGGASLHEAPRQHLDGASLIPAWQHVQNDTWGWSLCIYGTGSWSGWPRRVRARLDFPATSKASCFSSLSTSPVRRCGSLARLSKSSLTHSPMST